MKKKRVNFLLSVGIVLLSTVISCLSQDTSWTVYVGVLAGGLIGWWAQSTINAAQNTKTKTNPDKNKEEVKWAWIGSIAATPVVALCLLIFGLSWVYPIIGAVVIGVDIYFWKHQN